MEPKPAAISSTYCGVAARCPPNDDDRDKHTPVGRYRAGRQIGATRMRLAWSARGHPTSARRPSNPSCAVLLDIVPRLGGGSRLLRVNTIHCVKVVFIHERSRAGLPGRWLVMRRPPLPTVLFRGTREVPCSYNMPFIAEGFADCNNTAPVHSCN